MNQLAFAVVTNSFYSREKNVIRSSTFFWDLGLGFFSSFIVVFWSEIGPERFGPIPFPLLIAELYPRVCHTRGG